MTEVADTTSIPLCSVLVANYNGAALIEKCLHSVLEQRCSFTIEIIVHDDASTDNSASIVRNRFPGVKLIESKENVGFCVANNRMAAMAKGQYLLLLNNDAALFPDALATLYGAAASMVGDAVLGLPEYEPVSGVVVARGHLLDPFFNPVANLSPERGEVAMVIGACLWLRRGLWTEIGGFPDWFGSIGEDLYLCTRVRLRGLPVRVLAASGYWHASGASFGGGKVVDGRLRTTVRRRALSERNKSFVMLICYPTPLFQLVLPLHLLWLLIEGAIVALVRRDARLFTEIYGAALASLWRARGPLFEERHRVQSARRLSAARFLGAIVPYPHKLRMFLRHGLPEVK